MLVVYPMPLCPCWWCIPTWYTGGVPYLSPLPLLVVCPMPLVRYACMDVACDYPGVTIPALQADPIWTHA